MKFTDSEDTQVKRYIERNIKSGILVSKTEEQNYCKDNNLILKRLKSGSKILGYQSKNQESNKSYIDIYYNQGSFSDPKNKLGLHQLFSINLLNKKLIDFFDLNLIDSSSSCELFSTKIAFSGFYSKKYSFGLGEVLKFAIENLNSLKFNNYNTLEDTKKLVISRIISDNTDFAYGIWDAVDNLIFKKNSIYLQGIYGNPDSLLSIKNKDLNSLARQIILPQNTTYFVESNGDYKNNKCLVEDLQKIISKNEVGDQKTVLPKNFLSITDFENLNDNSINRVNLQIKNGICFYSLCYEINTSQDSTASYILDILKTSLLPKIFEQSLQYYGLDLKNGVLLKKYLGGKSFLHFYFVAFSKNELYYTKTIKKCVNRTFKTIKNDENLINTLLNKYKQNILLRPNTGAYNFMQSKNSLFSFDLLTNTKILDENYLKISYKHIVNFIQSTLNKKISFIVGDLE